MNEDIYQSIKNSLCLKRGKVTVIKKILDKIEQKKIREIKLRKMDNKYNDSQSRRLSQLQSSVSRKDSKRYKAMQKFKNFQTKKNLVHIETIYSSEEEEDQDIDFSEAYSLLKNYFSQYKIHELIPLEIIKNNHLERNIR